MYILLYHSDIIIFFDTMRPWDHETAGKSLSTERSESSLLSL